jgi:hypothetical protein
MAGSVTRRDQPERNVLSRELAMVCALLTLAALWGCVPIKTAQTVLLFVRAIGAILDTARSGKSKFPTKPVKLLASHLGHLGRGAGLGIAPLCIRACRKFLTASEDNNADLRNSESPRFIGRAVAALANDSDIMLKSGKVLVAATLAQEYGFTDVDGNMPKPLALGEA